MKNIILVIGVLSMPVFLGGCEFGGSEGDGSHAEAQFGQSRYLVSQHSFDETQARLRKAIETRGLKIFEEIDHSRAAKSVGLDLQNNRLILFGNPKAGTLLMQQNPEIGLELPMKALVYQQEGEVRVRITNITALARQYGLNGSAEPFPNLALTLDQIASESAR